MRLRVELGNTVFLLQDPQAIEASQDFDWLRSRYFVEGEGGPARFGDFPTSKAKSIEVVPEEIEMQIEECRRAA